MACGVTECDMGENWGEHIDGWPPQVEFLPYVDKKSQCPKEGHSSVYAIIY